MLRLNTTAAAAVSRPKHTKGALFPDGQHLGIRVLHAPAEASVDIIFIHGITGHPYKTFATHEKTPIYWPTQLLSRDIPTARVLAFGYNADVVKFFGPAGQNNIREHAATLISDVAAVRGEDRSTTRPIILVVHSLGGLVVKKALCISELAAEPHERQLHQTVLGVAFLGTPHRGSDVAPFASGVARILKASGTRTNVDIISLLRRDSEALADIEAAFGTWLRKNLEFKLTCFFEEKEVVGCGMVVSKDSAKISGYPQLPIPANHMDMARFESANATGYRRILGELRRWLREGEDEGQGNNGTSAGDALDFAGCMETLSFPEMNHRGADIENAAEGTCKWIVDHPVYSQWSTNGQGLLWVKGKPGSGKSTLIKYIIRQLQGTTSTPTLNITFFFHGRGTELQKSSIGLFRALLHQIGDTYPRAIRGLIKQYLKYREETTSAWSWRTQDLEDLLISEAIPTLLQRTNLSIYIDALDECGEAEARRLVSFFSRAYDRSSSHAFRLSICFSCRHYPIIAPDICEQIVVESANDHDISTYINQTLSQHVQDEEELKSLRQELESRARQVFLWVVVVLPNITRLYSEGQTLQQILEYIKGIPPELHSLYKSLAKELSEKSGPDSSRLFQIICYSRETLSISDLRIAFNYAGGPDSATRTLEEWTVLSPVKTNNQMRKKLRSLSAGMAEETPSGVQLTHQTVQDYLVEQGFSMLSGVEGRSPSQLLGEANHMLARTCLLYLVSLEKPLSSIWHRPAKDIKLARRKIGVAEGLERSVQLASALYPLLGYSVRHWLAHTSLAEASEITQNDIVQYLGPSGQEVVAFWSAVAVSDHIERLESGQPTQGEFREPQRTTTLLHESVKYNIESLAWELLGVPWISYLADSNGRLPLTYAIWGASDSIAKLMLLHHEKMEHDINSELRSGEMAFTAFQLALGNGREKLSLEIASRPSFLLPDNMVVNEQLMLPENTIFSLSSKSLGNGCTVLDIAVAFGFDDVCDYLLANLPRDSADTPDTPHLCMVAVQHKQMGMLRRFLSIVTPSEKLAFSSGGKNELILNKAVETCFHEGIDLLLSCGFVALNGLTEHRGNQSPLHIAVAQGDQHSMQQLLSHVGVDVNTCLGYLSVTPLLLAIKLGFSDGVAILCSCSRVDPNLNAHPWPRPVELAAQMGDVESLAVLLNRADLRVDFRDSKSQSILWHAISKGQSDVARLLLAERRSEFVYLRDQFGMLPSLARVDQDVIDTVEGLSTSNQWTPCDATFGIHWPEERSQFSSYVGIATHYDSEGNTLLMWAVIKGWDKEAIAMINMGDYGTGTKDNEGRSLLMNAIRCGNLKIVRWLLAQPGIDVSQTDCANRNVMWYCDKYIVASGLRSLVFAKFKAASDAGKHQMASPLDLPELLFDRQVGRYHISMTKVPKGRRRRNATPASDPSDRADPLDRSWWARRRSPVPRPAPAPAGSVAASLRNGSFEATGTGLGRPRSAAGHENLDRQEEQSVMSPASLRVASSFFIYRADSRSTAIPPRPSAARDGRHDSFANALNVPGLHRAFSFEEYERQRSASAPPPAAPLEAVSPGGGGDQSAHARSIDGEVEAAPPESAEATLSAALVGIALAHGASDAEAAALVDVAEAVSPATREGIESPQSISRSSISDLYDA
ncbi:hypothetical protein RB598_001598 [Gaeumannomyces tritici]